MVDPPGEFALASEDPHEQYHKYLSQVAYWDEHAAAKAKYAVAEILGIDVCWLSARRGRGRPPWGDSRKKYRIMEIAHVQADFNGLIAAADTWKLVPQKMQNAIIRCCDFIAP